MIPSTLATSSGRGRGVTACPHKYDVGNSMANTSGGRFGMVKFIVAASGIDELVALHWPVTLASMSCCSATNASITAGCVKV